MHLHPLSSDQQASVLAGHRRVENGDVALFEAADDVLARPQAEPAPVHRRVDADHLHGQRLGFAQAPRDRPHHRTGGSRPGEILERQPARRVGVAAFVSNRDEVAAHPNLGPAIDGHPAVDASPVHPDAVGRAQVFDEDLPVLEAKRSVAPRDLLVFDPNVRALVPAEHHDAEELDLTDVAVGGADDEEVGWSGHLGQA